MVISVGNISVASEEVSNNITNTNLGQSGRKNKANKNGLGIINKNGMRSIDIEAKIRLDKYNKSQTYRTNIVLGKKDSAETIIKTNSDINVGIKIIDWHIMLASLVVFAPFAVNYEGHFDFFILRKTLLGITTSNSHDYLAIFAVFTNISL